MRYDQVRREFKRTLWDEELDNDWYVSPFRVSFDLGFLHQFDGKKYRCFYCRNEFEEKDLVFLENGTACNTCYQVLAGNIF